MAAAPTLKRGALNLFDSTIIAVSSVAPAYSVATALAGLSAVVAFQMPAAVWVGFIPVAGIATAFYYLNRADPNCGASYTWVSKALSPDLGFVNGWIILVTDVVFCAFAGPQAGQATLQLVNNAGLTSLGPISLDAANLASSTFIGLVWIVIVTWAVIRGIRLAANFQWVLCAIEYLIVVAIAVGGILKGGGSSFSLDWLNPLSFGTPAVLAGGVVITVFLYWGWDTTANINEESQEANENPGKAGLLGMLALLGIFLIATISVQMTLTPDELANSGSSTLDVWAKKVFPEPWASLGVLALISSTVATLQTTLLPAVRTAFAMGRDGVLGRVWSQVNPRYQTPLLATVILAGLTCAIMLLDIKLDQLSAIITAGVTAIGLMVAFYYGIAGLACVVYYRRQLRQSARNLVFMGLVPGLSALVLWILGLYLLWSLWTASDDFAFAADNGKFEVVVTLVMVLSAVPALIWARVRHNPPFFRMKRESAPAASA